MAKTNAERQAAKRDRKVAAGLVRREIWIAPALWAKVQRYIKKIVNAP
jgi:hypothetical protein